MDECILFTDVLGSWTALRILNVKAGDFGIYSCRGENIYGKNNETIKFFSKYSSIFEALLEKIKSGNFSSPVSLLIVIKTHCSWLWNGPFQSQLQRVCLSLSEEEL